MPRESITLRWTPPNGRPRRLRFEPRATGGHNRIEDEWTGEEWRTVGSEIVARVGLEAPAAVVVDGSPTLEFGAGETYHGP